MATRTLTVKVVGDEADLLRAFKKSSRAADKFNADMAKTGAATKKANLGFSAFSNSVAGATAGLVGGAGIVAALKTASEAASNLAEQTAKADVVFGQSSATVKDFANNALGLAKDQALEASAAMGGLFRPLGFTEQAAADLSVQLTKLAVDLASFSNASPEEALIAIRAALVGEFEPARRFQIILNAAKVQTEALRLSGKKLAADLTDQEKVQARVNLIMRQSVLAQGDYAKTSKNLANQQRTLDANLRNLAATVGGKVNPALTSYVGLLNDALEFIGAINDRQLGKARDPGKSFAAGVVDTLRSPAVANAFATLPTVGPIAGALQTGFQKAGEKSADDFLKGFGQKFKEGFTVALSPINTAGAGGITEFFRKNLRQPGTATPFQDLKLANAVATRSLREQLKIIRQTIGVLSGRLARAGTLKAKTALREEINRLQEEAFGIVQTLNQAKQAAAAARRAAQEAARERKKAQQEAAADARTKAQLALLGLGPTTFKDVQKALGRISQAVKGTFLDTGKTRSLLAHIRQILKAGIKNVSQEVLDAIKQLLDDIDQQLEKRTGRSRTKFQKQGIDTLVNGLGLTPEQERALRGRLGARGATGQTATGPSASAFGVPVKGGGGISIQTVILHGVQSKSELMRDLQKEGQRRSGSRRGPNAGNSLGLA